jgi:hypothetical protein
MMTYSVELNWRWRFEYKKMGEIAGQEGQNCEKEQGRNKYEGMKSPLWNGVRECNAGCFFCGS